MNQYSLCFILVSTLSFAVADLTPAQYLSLVSQAPYRSFVGFPKPDCITADVDYKLQQLAAQYGLNVQDFYQWLILIQTDSPNTSIDDAISWIGQIASEVHSELNGMYALPSMMRYPMLPNVAQQLPMVPGIRVYRREPQPAEGLVEAIVDDTTNNVKSAYDNVMNFVDRIAPQTTASLKNVVNALVGSGSDSQPNLSDKLNSNIRYMMADN